MAKAYWVDGMEGDEVTYRVDCDECGYEEGFEERSEALAAVRAHRCDSER